MLLQPVRLRLVKTMEFAVKMESLTITVNVLRMCMDGIVITVSWIKCSVIWCTKGK